MKNIIQEEVRKGMNFHYVLASEAEAKLYLLRKGAFVKQSSEWFFQFRIHFASYSTVPYCTVLYRVVQSDFEGGVFPPISN